METKLKRISYDEQYMEMAHTAKKRSTCLSRNVGAVLVKDNMVLATGYNGAPKGITHCEVVGCIRKQLGIESGKQLDICRAVHAEQNCIIQAAYFGAQTKDSSIYVTASPCYTCAKMLINAGVKEVIIDDVYPDEKTFKLFEEAGIKIRKYKD